MAGKNGPHGTGETGRGSKHEADIRDDELERRRGRLLANFGVAVERGHLCPRACINSP